MGISANLSVRSIDVPDDPVVGKETLCYINQDDQDEKYLEM